MCYEEGSRGLLRFIAIALITSTLVTSALVTIVLVTITLVTITIAVRACADHVVQQIHRALNEVALYLRFGKLSTTTTSLC